MKLYMRYYHAEFLRHCGCVGECPCSLEMQAEEFRSEVSECLQVTLKWFSQKIKIKSMCINNVI